MGRLFPIVFAAIAELEVDTICERAVEGQAAARKRNVRLGRRPSFSPRYTLYVPK
jgi:DNA invertase Pin-like site-specific DNA recombinase